MAAFRDPRREAFAWVLAEGGQPLQAYNSSGYTCPKANESANAKRVAAHPDMVARVAEIRQQMNWSETADVGMVINELAWLVRKARALDSAAGLMAAKTMLLDVVRLKDRLNAGVVEPLATPFVEPSMSHEEWLATYAVKR